MLTSDSRNQECRAFFEKPGRNRIRITLFVETVEYDFTDFIFRSRLKSGEVRVFSEKVNA